MYLTCTKGVSNLARLEVDEKLLDQIKEAYPEMKGLTYTGLVEWALRKVLGRAV